MININKLNFKYSSSQILFDGLSLSMSSAGIYGLLGKNGAGKSSLLKLISGLLFPNSGECNTLGQVARDRLPAMLENIYYLPEDIFLPNLNAQAYVSIYSPYYPKFDHALFKQSLEEFSVAETQLLTLLSHGQKKKFLIAFALATRCALLLFDEPTNGLDIPSKAQFKKIMASIISEDQTIIISTHQVHDIEQMIDQVIFLDTGKIILNHSMHVISSAFSFTRQSEQPQLDECIYYEKSFSGYHVIRKHNKLEDESEVNLELLFNAVLDKNQIVNTLLQQGKHHE